MKKKKIVVIGGGTGTFTVLSGLRSFPFELSAVVSMADDGGSSGILREEFGILPPGDIRQALIALSSHPSDMLSKLFSYRFCEGGINGHNFGNLMLTALERITGSFEKAVAVSAGILNVQGDVIPCTLSHVRLYAKLQDGSVIKGERNIDIPKHNGTIRVKKIWLRPCPQVNPRATAAIRKADLVVLAPGDLYTSILPNILVEGIKRALLDTRAKKVYVLNIMTKLGETHGFRAVDFVSTLEHYLSVGFFDHIVVNSTRLSSGVLARYKKHHSFMVDSSTLEKDLPLYAGKVIRVPLLRRGWLVRHDSMRLARTIKKLL